uniref:Uncharacterized protein n=1 Tax=Meloidogyne enterolobii TaxID=390850 RepID=A0A6V7XW68_MELEN|nr:unnamed protein product [Meloidogyne enterolobii]
MNSLKMLVIFGFVFLYLAEIQVGIQAMKKNEDEHKIQDAQPSNSFPKFEDSHQPSKEKKTSNEPSLAPLPSERPKYPHRFKI